MVDMRRSTGMGGAGGFLAGVAWAGPMDHPGNAN